MKVYAAIGHFKGSKNITSVAYEQSSKKDFMKDCCANAFVPYVVITETMLEKISACDCDMDVYELVKKMTTNYRVWNEVTDYLTDSDGVYEKVRAIKTGRA